MRRGADRCNQLAGPRVFQAARCAGFLLLLFSALPLRAQAPADSLTQARSLASAGKFTEAVESYRRMVASDPKSFEATIELAQSLLAIDDWKEAEEFAAKAELLRPTDPAPAAVRGDALYRSGDPREAGFRYLRALSLSQKNVRALIGLASLRWQRRETDGALTYLREALSIDPSSADAYYWLAKTFEERNQFSLAADAYERYLQSNTKGFPHQQRREQLLELIPFFRGFGSAAAVQISGPREITVPIEIQAGAPVISAELAGGIHLNLLLGTTSEFALTLGPEAARKISASDAGAAHLDLIFEQTACRLAHIDRVRIGQMELREVPAAIADLKGLSARLGRDVDGILGLTWLRDLEITIDYKTRQARFALPPLASFSEQVNQAQASGTPQVLSIKIPLHSVDHRLLFFAEAKDGNATMLLSTSSNASVLSKERAARLAGADAGAAGAPSVPFEFELATGKFPLGTIPTSDEMDQILSRDLGFQITAALGNSFLSKLQRLTINLASMTATFDIDLSSSGQR